MWTINGHVFLWMEGILWNKFSWGIVNRDGFSIGGINMEEAMGRIGSNFIVIDLWISYLCIDIIFFIIVINDNGRGIWCADSEKMGVVFANVRVFFASERLVFGKNVVWNPATIGDAANSAFPSFAPNRVHRSVLPILLIDFVIN